MWTSTVELNFNRAPLMRLLSLVYPRIYYSALSPLRVANVPRSALPGASWVRVRNRLAGIGGSDLHLVHADTDVRTSVAALPPHYKHVYPGHEVVGEVIEIGEGVQRLRVGDRVVLQYGPNCLSSGAKPVCRACAVGNYNLCEYGALPGPQPIGGGWSEEMLLHEQQLFRLPTELSDEQGVLLEPTAVALHGVLRHLPQANDKVLIIGAGTIGLLTLQILHALVPKARISVFAHYPFQVEHATRLGADHIIYPIDPYASVQRVTQSRLYKGILGNRTLAGGYDVIYDTVGQQKTLHHALRWLRVQGTVVLVGASPQMMHIDLTPLWQQEISLLGSLSHGRETGPLGLLADLHGTSADCSTFDIVTALMQQKRIQPEELITHRFALNKYQEALQAVQYKKSSQAVKVLFDYALLPASAVPHLRASARSRQPALSQPQGAAFMEELVKGQRATGPQGDAEREAVVQADMVQQTPAPEMLETAPPPVLAREAAQASLNGQALSQDYADEDTDPAIPAIRRSPHDARVSAKVIASSPQTPMPPEIEPVPVLSVETPEKRTDEFEVASLAVQPMLEPQRAETASELPTATDDALAEVQPTLLANEGEPVPASSEAIEMTSTDDTQLEEAVELLPDEEESSLPTPEIMDINALTEEQLPTQTVLDHLFDADGPSMPAFLAQLSNFVPSMTPELPTEEVEGGPVLPEPAEQAPSVEEAAALVEPSEQAQLIEEVEASQPEPAETALSVEETQATALPEPAETASPTQEAEIGLLPDTSADEVATDSADQSMEDLTARIKAIPKPQAKGKQKTAKPAQTSALDGQEEEKRIEEQLLPKTQTEQVAVTREQVATNTDEKAE